MNTAGDPVAAPVALTSGPSLASCFANGTDNFLILRLLAASAVIFGHSYAVSDAAGAQDFVARLNLGTGVYTGSLAVDIFFVISGFLVTGSFVRRSHFWSFAQSRLLRVIPGYAVCIAVTAWIIGPLVSKLSITEYFSQPDTWRYVWENLKFAGDKMRWTLPGVFEDNWHANIVNGSLWTLPAEMQMYMWLGLLGLVGLWRRKTLATGALLALIFSQVIWPGWSGGFLHADFVRLSGLFITGALFYLHADRIPLNAFLLVGLGFACFLLRDSAHYGHLFVLTVAYATFWFAYIPKIPASWIRGDYSYGVYLWGFPCQQIIAQFAGNHGPMANFCMSLPFALGLAVLSWHYVESPALKLKRRRLKVPAPSTTEA